MSEADDGGQGLVDFVGDGRGRQPQIGQSPRVGQLVQPHLGSALRGAAIADVAHQAREHQLAVHLELGDCQVYREDRAVLALCLQLPANADDARLAGHEVALDVAVVMMAVGRRHEHGDVRAQQLLRAIAEKPLGGGIHRLDDAVTVDGDDGVHGRIQERAQPRLRVPPGPVRGPQIVNADSGHAVRRRSVRVFILMGPTQISTILGAA